MSSKWDKRFLRLAKEVATWSKDPSTKVGCVIVDENKRIVSTGYNGFPKNVIDSKTRYQNRNMKYPMVLHAEANAILFAQRDLSKCTLYVLMIPCSRCTGLIIQSGIKRIVTIPPTIEQELRWGKDTEIAEIMRIEAGVHVDVYFENQLK